MYYQSEGRTVLALSTGIEKIVFFSFYLQI